MLAVCLVIVYSVPFFLRGGVLLRAEVLQKLVFSQCFIPRVNLGFVFGEELVCIIFKLFLNLSIRMVAEDDPAPSLPLTQCTH